MCQGCVSFFYLWQLCFISYGNRTEWSTIINQGVIGQVILNRARTCDVLKGLLIKCIHGCAHEKDDSLF